MIWYFVILGIIITAMVLVWYRDKKQLKYPFKPRAFSANIDVFMILLNAYRKSWGVYPITKVDDHASMLMFDHVTYMVAQQKVSHDYLDARRSELVEMGATEIEEIVNGGFHTIKTAFDGFRKSTAHNRVMLNNAVNTVGAAIRQNSEGKYYLGIIFFRS